jgi:DNA-binding MarR family transcriptional regulator
MDKDSQKAIFNMKETWHKMDSLYNFYAKSVGLNFTSIIILQLLSNFSQTYTQKDICEKLELPKQLVNSIVKSLWEQGFVQLKEAKDRRNKYISFTDTGKEYVLSVLKPLEDAEFAVWEKLSTEEIVNYAKTMGKFVSYFEDVLKRSK